MTANGQGAAIEQGRAHEGDEPLELDADVVVVGSGAGGAVVACELAEAGQRVIVVDEGPWIPHERYGRMRPSESMRHLWRDGGFTVAMGLGDTPVVNVHMGSAIGGSSLLTGGVCFRTPEKVLHEWSQTLGLEDLTPERMDAPFASVERAVHVEEVPITLRSRSTTLFGEGLRRAYGVELKPLRRNTKGCNGCGRCNFGCPHGAKLSVDITYIPRALAAGARILSDACVDRVLVKGDRAIGVTGRLKNGKHGKPRTPFTVRARRVVVAAGAYASPLLLRRSGVGGLSGQVGKNLTLHPGFRFMARFDELVQGWKGALQSAYTDTFDDDGIANIGLFIPPGALAGTMPGIGPEHVERARGIPHLAVFGGMIHDDAGGEVHQIFGRPFMTYRMSRRNRAVIPDLMRKMANIFFAAGAREVVLPVLGQPAVTPDTLRTLDLERVPGKMIECASQHPLGTCRMGTSPHHAVVDPNGQTYELRDLYVADGSILPTSLGVNPQLSIMAMATRIAWKLRELS
ncbi:MAG: GMC family oxidoreductase [Deltaproteobacteria bacterium]|nr:GMC family oxidoreductase [Deltaproteobacteria bacterium]